MKTEITKQNNIYRLYVDDIYIASSGNVKALKKCLKKNTTKINRFDWDLVVGVLGFYIFVVGIGAGVGIILNK